MWIYDEKTHTDVFVCDTCGKEETISCTMTTKEELLQRVEKMKHWAMYCSGHCYCVECFDLLIEEEES